LQRAPASCHTPFRGESQLVDPASGRPNMWFDAL